jgi:very-short-patch-repair endonuclease
MKSKTIALINDIGFDPSQNYSNKQMLWLKYISEKENLNIRHCFNNKEFKIGNYSIDGYCEQNNTVYEFQGCWFHGCQKCFRDKSYNSIKKTSMSKLFKSTEQRTEFIKSKGFNFVEIWEHNFDNLVKSNSDVKEYVKNNQLKNSLRPRDALFGGRTNASCLYYKCKQNDFL